MCNTILKFMATSAEVQIWRGLLENKEVSRQRENTRVIINNPLNASRFKDPVGSAKKDPGRR